MIQDPSIGHFLSELAMSKCHMSYQDYSRRNQLIISTRCYEKRNQVLSGCQRDQKSIMIWEKGLC